MRKLFPQKDQDQKPGLEYEMDPVPESENLRVKGSARFKNKRILITGGDSGIGKATAIAFAKEGAHVAVSYLNEHKDAEETCRHIEGRGGKCLLLPGDIGDESIAKSIVDQTLKTLGGIDILINNAAEQHPTPDILKITEEQLIKTFRTNIFSLFFVIKAALPHMTKGACIINTASVTAYRGSPHLLDYSSTKGAIVAFTRSLALNLASKNIRVNAVAPGPIWTPLIPSTFSASEEIKYFGSDVPMGRAGQPYEVAPCYLFLASEEASYITGQVLHPNGGEIING